MVVLPWQDMIRGMKKTLRVSIFCCWAAFLGITGGSEASTFIFSQDNSAINGSIGYTLVGKYQAAFGQFEGEIRFNDKSEAIESVVLKINASSIQSKHPSLDRIVKSQRILDVQSFPGIIFESTDIVSDAAGCHRATGNLTLHGVTRTISFPFSFEILRPEGAAGQLQASGTWVIPRKEYGIIWNKILDKGGIIVGNHITVDWRILAGKI